MRASERCALGLQFARACVGLVQGTGQTPGMVLGLQGGARAVGWDGAGCRVGLLLRGPGPD